MPVRSPQRTHKPWVTLVLCALTLASLLAVSLRFRLEPNVASLLPERGEAAALGRYVRAFGGGDLAVVMVQGPDSDENNAVADQIAKDLSQRHTVRRAAAQLPLSQTLDPWLLWRHADARVQQRLADALTPAGMRDRLEQTRALLLAPGSGSIAETIAADPLRLSQLVVESSDIGSGVRTQADGRFATDDGTMHLVLVQPAGQALRGADARAFVSDANAVLAPIQKAHPNITLGLTGGHAIAAATEEMLIRDFAVSGTLAMILASIAFALLFPRLRALLAVMPPLILGSLWTAGLATLFPGGLSAIAVAFMSVVVGVGVDTGIHVYAALLDARQQGLQPFEAANQARTSTQRTVLIAAVTAGVAFSALALSDIGALRQLGLLCGAGEVLTAIAILLVTPRVGQWLERHPSKPISPPAWANFVYKITSNKLRAGVLFVVSLLPIAAVTLGAFPPLAQAIVAIRPAKLEPLKVQQRIFDAFGGKKGQWIVLVSDTDSDHARTRADALAEHLASMKDDIEAVDALTALVPSTATQQARYQARDALNLPAKAVDLEQALTDIGFAKERFSSVLDALRNPSQKLISLQDLDNDAAIILLSRYLGSDRGDTLVAIYVRPRDDPGASDRIAAAVRAFDPQATLTGYGRLEDSLRATLVQDMPRIALVAAVLVVIALAASLRSVRDVTLATLVVIAEIATVLLLIRLFKIPLHAYDALVIPVLLGITVDEGMFLLHRVRTESKANDSEEAIRSAIRHEGPLIAATALTTAAGFGALSFCAFDGLRDLGRVGALGSIIGLVIALVVVPAGLRIWGMGNREQTIRS